VFLIIAVGILVEIPLIVYFLSRSEGQATPVITTPNSLPAGSSALPLHPVAGNFKPDDTKLASCTEQTCFEQAYGDIAYYQGPKAAFALIEKQYTGGADPSCHRVVHMVGAATLARNHGNVARTFAQGSSICWSGYYHGVLERAFAGIKSYNAASLAAKSRALCSDRQVRASSWLTYQCLHGLGHGLMITTGLQLPLSLDVCRRLDGAWDQTACKGGVFMENVITSYGGKSPYVRDDDPLYPCDWVREADKYTCYQQATTRIIRVVGTDWAKIAKTCSNAERRWVSTCFGSLGQTASSLGFRKPSNIIKTCDFARPYGGERECIRYAAMDIAGTYSGGTEASKLCTRTLANLRGSCYEAIGRMLRHLRNTTVARDAECRSIAARAAYVAQCIAGSTKQSAIPGLTR
jgi:hypothetical protein